MANIFDRSLSLEEITKELNEIPSRQFILLQLEANRKVVIEELKADSKKAYSSALQKVRELLDVYNPNIVKRAMDLYCRKYEKE